MELKWKTHKWDFNPTTAQLQTPGPTEFPVMDVHRGTLIGSVSVRVNTAFDGTTPTASIGDDGAAEGFVTEADLNIGAGGSGAGLFNGTGQYLCTKHTTGPNANGKLYTEDDTIELVYTGVAPDGGNEVTQGALSVIVTYCEIE